jgi:O-antigen/teichoic acid export membrane protein
MEIVLLMTFVNRFGISGAAAASAITHLLGFLISYAYVSSRFTGFKIPIFAIRIGLAALIVYLVAAFYTPSGIMLLFYYGVLLFFFFSLLVIMKEIKLQNLKLALAKAWKTDRIDQMTDKYFP